jgi:hypothetical protein
MKAPIPRTRQITSSAKACGLRRKKLMISCSYVPVELPVAEVPPEPPLPVFCSRL